MAQKADLIPLFSVRGRVARKWKTLFTNLRIYSVQTFLGYLSTSVPIPAEESIFLSQGELINFAEMVDGQPVWTVASVKKRHATLFDFALNTWTPDAYHVRSRTDSRTGDFQADEEIAEENLVGDEPDAHDTAIA